MKLNLFNSESLDICKRKVKDGDTKSPCNSKACLYEVDETYKIVLCSNNKCSAFFADDVFREGSKRLTIGIIEVRKMNNPKFSVEKIKSLFYADFETGKIFHKPRIKKARITNSWNTRYAHKETGWPDGKGYLRVRIEGSEVLCHRIVWLLMFSEWPKGQIDHINHNGSDNRIKNLRCVNNKQNGKNQKLFKTNTSGVTGVCFQKRGTFGQQE